MFDEIQELVHEHGEGDDTKRQEFIQRLKTEKEFRAKMMSPWSFALFNTLPEFTQEEILYDPENMGNVDMQRIETEKLLAYLVGEELKKRKANKTYSGSFATITHYFGYQGRSALPSLFDCQLGATYGFTAGILAASGVTGYCVTARGLIADVDDWHLGGIPLVSMSSMVHKSSYGNNMAIVKSGNVDLHGEAFKELKRVRQEWVLNDLYSNPGPTQFGGKLNSHKFKGLRIRDKEYLENLKSVEMLSEQIKSLCRFGTHQEVLGVVKGSLEN